jgi:hypothetical protein
VIDDSRGVRDRRRRVARYEDAPYDVRQFRSWMPDATVTDVRRIPLASAPGDARWKLFELTVDRKAFARDPRRSNQDVRREDVKRERGTPFTFNVFTLTVTVPPPAPRPSSLTRTWR